MRSISINGTDIRAWGMILEHLEIGAAPPRISTIEVAGRDGLLDITDFVGLTFGNRTITAVCLVNDGILYGKNRLYAESINGQNVELTVSDEPNLVWSGRIIMTDHQRKGRSRKFGEVTFEMSAQPFPVDAVTGEEVRDVQIIG